MKNFPILAVLICSLFTPAYAAKVQPQTVEVKVTEKGFEPNSIDVKPNTPVILKLTRETDDTCAMEVQIPEKKIKRKLPLHKEVVINLGSLSHGEVRFGCGMKMMEKGMIFVR